MAAGAASYSQRSRPGSQIHFRLEYSASRHEQFGSAEWKDAGDDGEAAETAGRALSVSQGTGFAPQGVGQTLLAFPAIGHNLRAAIALV